MTKKMKVRVGDEIVEREFTELPVGRAHIWDNKTASYREPKPIYQQVPEHDPLTEVVLYPLGDIPCIVSKEAPNALHE